jgi:hypothetical protein
MHATTDISEPLNLLKVKPTHHTRGGVNLCSIAPVIAKADPKPKVTLLDDGLRTARPGLFTPG